MEDKFQVEIDGFPMQEYLLSWSKDYQYWYLLYEDLKYPGHWGSFTTIEYQKNSNEMMYNNRFEFLEGDYKDKIEWADAEQRFKKFMELFLEENKFYFLLNRPEDV